MRCTEEKHRNQITVELCSYNVVYIYAFCLVILPHRWHTVWIFASIFLFLERREKIQNLHRRSVQLLNIANQIIWYYQSMLMLCCLFRVVSAPRIHRVPFVVILSTRFYENAVSTFASNVDLWQWQCQCKIDNMALYPCQHDRQ